MFYPLPKTLDEVVNLKATANASVVYQLIDIAGVSRVSGEGARPPMVYPGVKRLSLML